MCANASKRHAVFPDYTFEPKTRPLAPGHNELPQNHAVTSLDATRHYPSYAWLNFYDSAEAAVQEVTGVTHPTSTGHDDWVSFWDIPMGQGRAEAFRESMIRRGWAKTEIKCGEDLNYLEFA